MQTRSYSLLAGALLFAIPLGGHVRTPAAKKAVHPGIRQEQNESTAVERFAADLADSIRSGDLDRIMSHYEKSNTLVVFDASRPYEHHGWDAYRKSWQAFFADARNVDRMDLSDVRAHASGDLGYFSARWHAVITLQDGNRMVQDGRLTDILQKQGDKWLIIHEHSSVPAGLPPGDRQTGKESKPVEYADTRYRGDGTSGIEGTAMAGPTTPVQRIGQLSTRPLTDALITVQPADGGDEIARVRTDSEGRFRLPLTPGTYRLVPLAPNPSARLPRATPQPVTVTKGVFKSVAIDYDTGIR